MVSLYIQVPPFHNHNHAKDKNWARLAILVKLCVWYHDTFLLTRYVGEDFPWLGNAPKHGLWAEEVAIKTIMVIVDSIAAALF